VFLWNMTLGHWVIRLINQWSNISHTNRTLRYITAKTSNSQIVFHLHNNKPFLNSAFINFIAKLFLLLFKFICAYSSHLLASDLGNAMLWTSTLQVTWKQETAQFSQTVTFIVILTVHSFKPWWPGKGYYKIIYHSCFQFLYCI